MGTKEFSKLVSIASWVISVLLFLYAAVVVTEAVSTIRAGQVYHPPQYFVDHVGQAITAGLVALGIPFLALMFKKKRD